MFKNFSYLIFYIVKLFDFISKKILGRSILIYFKEFIEKSSYSSVYINNKKTKFFIPNFITKWRVDTFYSKEPETLEWIDSFDSNKKIIFWDIGANIGLYSIYAAQKYKNIDVVAFEPSTSNLRILSRNIHQNNLENKIKINQIALTNQSNKFLFLQESKFTEGWSMNAFGENFGYDGKSFLPENKYKIYGTSIDYLLENKILEVPNYIKIDVDGIEHLILEGGLKFLKKDEIKSLSIEINENFEEQYKSVLSIMKNSNFKLKNKKHSKEFDSSKKFSKIYNYLFEKNDQ